MASSMEQPPRPAPGWKYTVNIPRHILAKDAEGDSVVLYRVNVLLQSPEMSDKPNRPPSYVLRRYSQFRQLFMDLKNEFPDILRNRSLQPPPKAYNLFGGSNKELLEKRREELQQWLWRLISIPEVAKSKTFKSFLDFEKALQRAQQQRLGTPPPGASLSTNSPSLRGSAPPSEAGLDDDTRSEISGYSQISNTASVNTAVSAMAAMTDGHLYMDSYRGLATGQGQLASSSAISEAGSAPLPSGRLAMRVDKRADVRKLVDLLRRRLQQASADMADAAKEVGRLQTHSKALELQVLELESRLDGGKSAGELQLENALAEASMESVKLREELEAARALQQQLVDITSKLDSAEAMKGKALQQLEQQEQEASTKVVGLNEQVSNLQKQVKEDQFEIQRLKDALAEEQQQKEHSTNEAAELQQKLQEAEAVAEQLRSSHADAEQQAAANQRVLAKAVKTLRSDLAAAKQLSVDLEQQLQVARKAGEGAEAAASALGAIQQEVASLRDDKENITSGYEETKQELESLQIQHNALVSSSKQSQLELEALMKDKQALAVSHEKAQGELGPLRAAAKELQELQDEAVALRLENQTLREDFQQMAAEHESSKRELGSLKSSATEQVSRAKSDLANAVSENQALQEQVKRVAKEVEVLRRENGALKAAEAALREQVGGLTKATAAVAQLQAEVANLTAATGGLAAEKQALQAQVVSMTAATAALTAEKQALEAKLSALQSTLVSSKEQNQALRAAGEGSTGQLGASQEASKHLQQELVRLQAANQELKERVGELEDDVEREKAAVVGLQQMEQGLRKEMQALQDAGEQKDAAVKSAVQAAEKVGDMEQQVAGLEQANQELKTQLQAAEENLVSDAEVQQTGMHELRSRVQELTRAKAEAVQQVEEAREQLEQLQAAGTLQDSALAVKTKELEEAMASLAALQVAAGQREQQLVEMKAAVEKQEEALQQQRQQLQEAKEAANELRAKLQEQEVALDAAGVFHLEASSKLLAELEAEKQQVLETRAALEAREQELSAQLKARDEKAAEAQSKYEEACVQSSELRAQVASLMKQLKQLMSGAVAVEYGQNGIKEDEGTVARDLGQNGSLLGPMIEPRHGGPDVAALQVELAEVREQLHEARQQSEMVSISRLAAANGAAEKSDAVLVQQELEDRLQAEQAAAAQLRDIVQHLQQQAVVQTNSLTQLQKELEVLQASKEASEKLAQEKADVELQLARLQESTQSKIAAAEQLQAVLQQERAAAEQLQGSCNHLQVEIDRLKAEQATAGLQEQAAAEQLRASSTSLQQEVDRLKAEQATLQQDQAAAEQLRGSRKSLQQEVDRLKAEQFVLQQDRAAAAQLQEANRQLQQQLDKHSAHATARHSGQATVEQLQQEVAQLKQQLASRTTKSTEASVVDFLQGGSESDAQLAAVRAERDTLKSELEQVRARLQAEQVGAVPGSTMSSTPAECALLSSATATPALSPVLSAFLKQAHCSWQDLQACNTPIVPPDEKLEPQRVDALLQLFADANQRLETTIEQLQSSLSGPGSQPASWGQAGTGSQEGERSGTAPWEEDLRVLMSNILEEFAAKCRHVNELQCDRFLSKVATGSSTAARAPSPSTAPRPASSHPQPPPSTTMGVGNMFSKLINPGLVHSQSLQQQHSTSPAGLTGIPGFTTTAAQPHPPMHHGQQPRLAAGQPPGQQPRGLPPAPAGQWPGGGAPSYTGQQPRGLTPPVARPPQHPTASQGTGPAGTIASQTAAPAAGAGAMLGSLTNQLSDQASNVFSLFGRMSRKSSSDQGP